MLDVGCSSFNMSDVNLSKQLSAYGIKGRVNKIDHFSKVSEYFDDLMELG